MSWTLTLYPATPSDANGFAPFAPDMADKKPRPRYVLAFASVVTAASLEDGWKPARLEDGRLVEIRRADCGGRCHCAGEFRAFPAVTLVYRFTGDYSIVIDGAEVGRVTRRRGGYWRAVILAADDPLVRDDFTSGSWCSTRKEAVDTVVRQWWHARCTEKSA